MRPAHLIPPSAIGTLYAPADIVRHIEASRPIELAPLAPVKPKDAAHGWLGKKLKSTLEPMSAMVAGAAHCVGELLRDRALPQTKAEAAADAGALDVMRTAVRAKGDEAKPQIASWAASIAERGGKLTVLEHTAVAYILRSGLFDNASAPDQEFAAATKQSLTKSLKASWTNLTGEAPIGSALLDRLPKLTLRKTSREARVYHAASFQPLGSLQKPEELAARATASSLLRDYVPENSDIAIAAAVGLAGAFSVTGAAVIASTVLSYGFLSLSESVLHKFAGHQTKGSTAQWITKDLPADAPFLQRKVHDVMQRALSGTLERTRISHGTVHHFLTFKNSFTQMFDSPEHKARVDAFIEKQKPEIARDIREELYGSTLSVGGCLRVLRAVAPQTAAIVAASLCLGAPIWCVIPPILLAMGFPLSMARVHPDQHVDKDKARAQAGPLLLSILETRWAAWSTRNHELHHEGECNYNLAFAGADGILGTLVQPNLDDLFRMRDDGTLHY